jgi:hypothetical protein
LRDEAHRHRRRRRGSLDPPSVSRLSEDQADFATDLLDPVCGDGRRGRAGFHGPGADVELRAVPGAGDRAAGQYAVGQGAALVRAAVVEGDVPPLGPRQDDPPVANPQQLHLVDLQLVGPGDGHRLVGAGLDDLLAPLAGPGVAVDDANLVAVDQRPPQPAADGQQPQADGVQGDGPEARRSPGPRKGQASAKHARAETLTSMCQVARVLAELCGGTTPR